MTKRMLIDATHAEETRVVVLDGHRLEDFDVETSTKRQLKGNIYLAKVVRVEPSLQAAFVEYGGGRHGFLAFGEIHPDYYQIPVADRQRLLEIAAEEAREEEEAEDRREAGWAVRTEQPAPKHHVTAPAEPPAEEGAAVVTDADDHGAAETPSLEAAPSEGEPEFGPEVPFPLETDIEPAPVEPAPHPEAQPDMLAPEAAAAVPAETAPVEPPHAASGEPKSEPAAEPHRSGPAQPAMMPTETRYGDADAMPIMPEGSGDETDDAAGLPPNVVYAGDAEGAVDDDAESGDAGSDSDDGNVETQVDDAPPPETIGGESDQFEGNGAEEASRRRSSRMLRSYRIQEVIRRRQILLIQVVKEERGTKGAALTTYISLAGRYCVLMPNSPRGGGISRKITSAADRKRLKEITAEMEIPKGMGLIVRTAGAARPKPEIRRDCEYLMRLWDDIREQTMRSMAPALIYEEASLIKRSIRDVYSRDVDEIIVDGEEGWKQAHDFMRMLMPSHAKKVQLWRPQGIQTPLFAKYQVDLQLDAMLAPTVQLKSGGYLVINQTEALVAIDVNSGRSTRERGIEETALKTNLEAADEVARQLRLRDLAGLIVIDFIDMEARKANAMVERRMKDALKNDRARIQLGAISHFGLMEMSRQRLRPSLAETSFVQCPHCNGLGHVRSVESAAIHVLRSVEEEGSKLRAAAILVYAASPVVMYILNHKRDRLGEIEARYAMRISFGGDDTLLPPAVRIDRLRPQVADAERLLTATAVNVPLPVMESYDDEEDEEDLVLDEAPVARPAPAPRPAASAEPASGEETAASIEEGEQRKRRRRRRRGGRRDGAAPGETSGDQAAMAGDGESAGDAEDGDDETGEPGAETAPELAADAVAVPAQTGGELPANEQVEFDENGEAKRRRGRRGGRRRRRVDGEPGSEAAGEGDGEAAHMAPVATPPAPPAYVGPTPANPFNNTFDIFDMLEQAEEAAAMAPVVKQVPIMAAPPAPEPQPQPQPAEQRAQEPEATMPPPVIEPAAPEPLAPETSAAEPVAEPVAEAPPAPVAAAEPAPAPEPEVPAEPAPPPPPPKRGWWRR
eukprot:gene2625-2665_t